MMKIHAAAALTALACILGAPLAPMPALARSPFMPGMNGPVRTVAVGTFDGARLLAAVSPSEVEYALGALRIKAPWMRATPKGAAVAGGYFAVTNLGTEPDRLVSIASEIASSAEVHEMNMSGGMMTMRLVDKPLEIRPGGTLELKPGGYHVMFTELRRGLKEGDKVKATLVFEKAGKIEIEFLVGGLAAVGPAGGGQMPKHKM
jgi:copper(I)-binding protein